MDASHFTAIRLLSGAIFLYCLLALSKKDQINHSHFNEKSIKAGFYLFAYAACFSFAYIQLDTATGALVLFATVQLTMLAYQVIQYKRISWNELLGMGMAFLGFVYWMWPDSSQLGGFGILLMVLSGIAWGKYTLLGKGSSQPKKDTAINFIMTLPFTLLLIVVSFFISEPETINGESVFLAIISGAITSGLGYWIWYTVLPNLKITLTSTLQLTVPLIAALGGIIWVQEWPDLDFYISSALILSGIFIVNRKTV